ncbi:diguanylate cyclase [Massilia pinisoli]|uniref:Diguanylate cyclase n=1 Tax=Massilia pinisoli TaxID=1772194 RepID=A0ABT1ZLM8_9BURK|nr:ligand-binding sensor domain-containing diguanylate cyclase [Massilia pinisoli]MCS0580816.1 diguanylate cyclase [Massilia pinisoli]
MLFTRQFLLSTVLWIGTLLAVSFPQAATLPSAWAPFAQVSFRHHDEDALNSGTSLTQDRSGFIWLGTQTGLVRWDGHRTRLYHANPEQPGSLPDNYIQSMHTDAGGRVWIGTSAGGLARYDAACDCFATLRTAPRGQGNAHVAAIVDDGAGGIWVGTGAGLARVDAGGRFHGAASGAPQLAAPQLPAPGISALLRDRQGGLWIGTPEGLFYRSGDTAPLQAVHLAGPRPDEPSIRTLYEDEAGRVWIGTSANGAFVAAAPGAAPRSVVEQGAHATLEHERVTAVVQKDADTIWLGTETGGIVEVDVQQETTRRLRYRADIPDSLRDDEINALLRERSGQLFVVTRTALSQHDPRPRGVMTVRAIGNVPGLGVYHIRPRPDGKVMLSVPGGAVDVDPHAGTVTEIGVEGTPGALPKGRVLSMANAPDGGVYFGTQQGLYRNDGEGAGTRRIEIPGRRADSAVWALAWQDGVLWLGGLDGLWAVRMPSAGPGTVLRREDQALGDRRVTALLPLDDGTVWVGTRSGVVRLDRDGKTVERLPADNADRTRAPNGFISSLLTDRKGRLWIGSFGNGVSILERTDRAGRRWFRRMTTADGLPDNSINMMVQDRTGLVWLSTDRNLASVQPDTFEVRRLGAADGVHVPTYWSSAGALGADGEVLFGGLTGLSVVFPDRLAIHRTQPSLAVTQLMLGGRPARLPAPGTLTIAPEDRARGFTVEFAALDYMPPEYRRYTYRLDGFDSTWIDADTAVRRASYNNLPPGAYRLHVRATDEAGGVTTLELPIRVLPAWYQQPWAHALGAVCVLALLAALVQARTSLLRRRQRELEAVVASRTAELRATQLQLETMAYNDALTDLPNRRRFNDELQRLAALGRRNGTPFALLLMDLDHFKHINDTLGHDAGDALLVAAAGRLRAAVRETDCVARLGGDEFAVLLTPASDAIVADVARRIVESMRAPVAFGPHTMHVSASIGAVLASTHVGDTAMLYKEADTALYHAKEAGRNTWRMVHPADVQPAEDAAHRV